MSQVGIEEINFYGGVAYLDVCELVQHRDLDMARFDNLLMKQKTIALPNEDLVTYGVNAAKPIIDKLTEEEKNQIKLLITCTESAFDFSKSASNYIHDYLGLSRNCRVFEIKQACYAGTAGFQMAVNYILSNTAPNAKALVIASDISRFMVEKGGDVLSQDWSYAEPSGGSGAVAMLISNAPKVFSLDVGAFGNYSFEVMDTCRPGTDTEAGDADLSLYSYLECYENALKDYICRVPEADYCNTFQYLSFHTPFGGMIKGAHRSIMRKLVRAPTKEIEIDFGKRVQPGLTYCQRVGNIMGGTVFLSLISTIAHADLSSPKRVGCFSYGSGCCSEFYSGVLTQQSKAMIDEMNIAYRIDQRNKIDLSEYDQLLYENTKVKFGARNLLLDDCFEMDINKFFSDYPALVLKSIKEFHREYEWTS